MYKWTTPTITITFPSDSVVLSTLGRCVVTLKQDGTKFDITPTVHDHSIDFILTQQQSGSFNTRMPVKLIVNFINSQGVRVCSDELEFYVERNLKNESITYSGGVQND